MKGRITCKQVNTAVDELNKAVDAKYVLLKTSKARMTEAVRRAIKQYKDQERKETKGVWIVMPNSINLQYNLITVLFCNGTLDTTAVIIII